MGVSGHCNRSVQIFVKHSLHQAVNQSPAFKEAGGWGLNKQAVLWFWVSGKWRKLLVVQVVMIVVGVVHADWILCCLVVNAEEYVNCAVH